MNGYPFDASVKVQRIRHRSSREIIQQYSIVHEHSYEGFEHIVVFLSSNEKWGALKLDENKNTHVLIAENIYDSTVFDPRNGLLEAVAYPSGKYSSEGNTFMFFNTDGDLVHQSEQFSHIQFDNFGNIIVSKSKTLGLLNEHFEEVIPCQYESLTGLKKNIFIALDKVNSRYLIINEKNDIIFQTSFSNKIFPAIHHEKVIVQEQDKYYVFDVLSGEKTKLPYDRIKSLYRDDIQPPRYITITDYVNNAEVYEDNYLIYPDHFIAEEGKYGVIFGNGEVCIPNIYDKIELLNEKYFKVALGKFKFEIDERNDNVTATGGKWGVADLKNKVVVPIQYTNIFYGHHNDTYIAYEDGVMSGQDDPHNGGYWWTVKDGRLINLDFI
ncbi:WG repeat protein [Chryseobacterium sp. 52]|uniref:WG repeat-containing protein n=1 Tax=Chryseobacterium sp. 52 TaxID=2035213 RepID=UPI000C1A28CF|nr:WG repeat-containing protein [Chryseobacterium sp. 52]PIF47231.1 WG repeat protein [Chryseobacterium sp. 52]